MAFPLSSFTDAAAKPAQGCSAGKLTNLVPSFSIRDPGYGAFPQAAGAPGSADFTFLYSDTVNSVLPISFALSSLFKAHKLCSSFSELSFCTALLAN